MSEDKVRREQEEKYFLERELALKEKLRQKFEENARLKKLEGEFGYADERILKALEETGFSRETIILLHVAPLLEVAWSDGKMTPAEAQRIRDLAKGRGVVPGTKAHDVLERALTVRPEREMFEAARRAIRLIAETLPAQKAAEIRTNLMSLVREVAAVSGGFLGLGTRVSQEEEAAIDALARDLEKSRPDAARAVVDKR